MKYRFYLVTVMAFALGAQEPATMEVRGTLHSDRVVYFHDYVVELSAISQHDKWRVDVMGDGTFLLRDVPAGDYVLRVLTYGDSVLKEEFVSVREHATVLDVAMPQEERAAPGGVISVRELQHPPAAKAVEAAARAQRLEGAGETQKAIEVLRKAIRISPDFAAAHTNLAAAYIRTGDYAGARREIARSLEIAGPNAVDLCNLAFVDTAERRYGDAVETARAALRADPGSGNAHYILGTLLLLDRRTEAEGLRHLEQAAPAVVGARQALRRWRAREGARR